LLDCERKVKEIKNDFVPKLINSNVVHLKKLPTLELQIIYFNKIFLKHTIISEV